MSQTPMSQDGAAGSDTCRNCHTALSGQFCHACGQQSREGETLRGRVAEAVTCAATPGGRFFESIIGLLTRPGQLTRDYNAGMRRQYVSPFVTLLFAMLVLHGVQWIAAGPDQALTHEQAVTSALERADRSLEAYATGEAAQATQQAQGPAILRGEESAARSALPEEERRERALSTQFFTDQARRAWNPVAEEPEQSSWENAWARSISAMPALFTVLGWLLIPLLLPVMLGLARGTASHGGLDHARFLAHSVAFVALALAASTALIAGGAPFTPLAAILIGGFFAHTAFHLRGAYTLGWPGTVWRSAALMLASTLGIAILTAGVTLWRTAL